jgi:hypothetical protein
MKFLKTQWETYFNGDLNEDETVRVVVERHGKAFTAKEVINKFDDFVEFIKSKPNAEFALSSAVFDGTQPSRGKETIKRSQSFIMDLDCYTTNEEPAKTDRFRVHELSKNIQALHTFIVAHKINELFKEQKIGALKPVLETVTGGGLQLVYKFDKFVNKSEAEKLSKVFRSILGDKKELFLSAPISKSQNVFYKVDKTCFDISHSQRVLGLPRRKYDGFIPYPVNEEQQLQAFDSSEVKDITENNVDWNKVITHMRKTKDWTDSVDTKKMLSLYVATKTINPTKFEKSWNSFSEVDKRVSKALIDNGINPFDVLKRLLSVEEVVEGEHYTTFLDPTRHEKNASMSLWVEHSKGIVLVNNFYSGQPMGLVSYITSVKQNLIDKNITTADVLEEMFEVFPPLKKLTDLLKLKSKVKKSENLERYIRVLKDDGRYIYYQDAQEKEKVYRVDVFSGEKVSYGSLTILVTTLLKNKFGISDLGTQLKEFTLKFKEEILHVVHETFEPNKPVLFVKNDIKYVNTWIATKLFRDVKARVKEVTARDGLISVNQGVDELREKAPTVWLYLNQMAQRGNVRWLMTWLSETAKFRQVSSIPIFFGTFGGGKDLFLTEVLQPFFGENRVKSVESKRVVQQFNGIMSEINMFVLNEGEIGTRTDIYEMIKAMSGSSTITVEKKRVDAKVEKRSFNIAIFNNAEIPLVHEASDRRITYFHQDVPLLKTLNFLGIEFEDFTKRIKEELVEFWTTILRLRYNPSVPFSSIHDKLYYRQVILMSPVGKLLIALAEGTIKDLAMEVLENETSLVEYNAVEKLFKDIQDDFNEHGIIKLFNINQIIATLKKRNSIYRNSLSTSQFIKVNELNSKGVTTELDKHWGQIIRVDSQKLKDSISTVNNLDVEYRTADGRVPTQHKFNQFEQHSKDDIWD